MNQLEQRAQELRRRTEAEHGPLNPGYLWVAVECNGCGRRIYAHSIETLSLETARWRLGPFGGDDYCPGCLG